MATDNDAMLSVPITVEERADRADIMAGIVLQIRAVKAQAKAKAFEYREAIEALMERLEAHSRVLMEGEESRRQMDLTFPQEQAAKALHDVGAAACVCEVGEDGIAVADPGCPVHGVERRADGTAKDSSERQAVERLAAEMREDHGGGANTTETLPKCDGNHGGPACADPECWAREEDDEPTDLEGRMDAAMAADQPQPAGEPVDVGTAEEPASVGRFRRGRRASAGGAA